MRSHVQCVMIIKNDGMTQTKNRSIEVEKTGLF